jgi:hypothetical protein
MDIGWIFAKLDIRSWHLRASFSTQEGSLGNAHNWTILIENLSEKTESVRFLKRKKF